VCKDGVVVIRKRKETGISIKITLLMTGHLAAERMCKAASIASGLRRPFRAVTYKQYILRTTKPCARCRENGCGICDKNRKNKCYPKGTQARTEEIYILDYAKYWKAELMDIS
jgi:cytidine deaminase